MIRGITLLVLTWLIDLPGLIVRLIIFLIPALIIASFMGSVIPFVVAFVLAVYPTFAVLIALGFPTGHLLTRWQLGARVPSDREREQVDQAMAGLIQHSGVRPPRHWYVIDAPTANAYVVGSTLYIERDLFQTPYLISVLAHELGHLNSADGRIILALRRLVFPVTYPIVRVFALVGQNVMRQELTMGRRPSQPSGCVYILFGWLVLFLGGGIGLQAFRRPWNAYWQGREYAADAYATTLGQGILLANALQSLALPLDVAVPFFSTTHPYTELRIDRLLRAAQEQPGAIPEPLAELAWRATSVALIALVLVSPLIYTYTQAYRR